MNRTFQACNAYYSGLLHDAANRAVLVDVEGYDVFTVTVLPTTGTWSSAVLSVRYGNDVSGPFTDFSTAVTLGNSTRGSGLIGVVGKYLAVEVTTPEGGNSYFDVMVNARRSEIPTEVAV